MHYQRGNALFLILIAVVLFAALSYAVTRSGRGGGSTEREQAELIAAEVMQYSAELNAAITRLMLVNGCQDTQISFDHPNEPAGWYTNPGAPADKSCHLFDPAGGNITWRRAPEAINWSPGYGPYTFFTGLAGSAPVAGFGSDLKNDLYMSIRHHPSDTTRFSTFMAVCRSINRKSGVSEVVGNFENLNSFVWTALGAFFTGSYEDSISPASGDGAQLAGKTAFCVQSPGGPWPQLVFPLLLR